LKVAAEWLARSPAELVVDAGADQIFGETHRAVGPVSPRRAVGTAQGSGRAADRAQIDVEIFELGTDRIGEEVFANWQHSGTKDERLLNDAATAIGRTASTAPAALAMLRAIRRSTGLRVFLSRHSSDFCCLHLIVECKPISVMLRFEYSLDLEVVTIAQGCGFLSINNDAAATDGTSQYKRHVFAAAP
jgi:hypothetical protein